MTTRKMEISWGNSQLNIPNVRKFDMSLSKAFDKYMLPVYEAQKKEFSVAYINRILDLNGPTSVGNSSTPERKLLAEISMGAFEIFNIYESLLDAEVYIRKFPYTRTRVSKSRHLKGVIANHLNNIYILKERIVRYLNILKKRYGKQTHADGKLSRKIAEILRKFTEEYFSGLNSVRNTHVHIEEFYDPDLDRISYLENFIYSNPTLPSLEHLKEYYDFEFNRIRKSKIKQIKSINADAEEMLDLFFDQIYSVVFDEADDLIVEVLI